MMTAEEFVRLCADEKKRILDSYFDPKSETAVGERIRSLTDAGVSADALYALLDEALCDNYYNLLLALDGEASLGGAVHEYKLYSENGELINPCGELEQSAFGAFME